MEILDKGYYHEHMHINNRSDRRPATFQVVAQVNGREFVVASGDAARCQRERGRLINVAKARLTAGLQNVVVPSLSIRPAKVAVL